MKYKKEIVVAYFKECGLPHCKPEYKFHPKRKWRIDFAFPEYKIGIEIQGGIWTGGRHIRGAGYKQDMEKNNNAVMLGWRMLYVEPKDLLTMETIEMIKTTIEVIRDEIL